MLRQLSLALVFVSLSVLPLHADGWPASSVRNALNYLYSRINEFDSYIANTGSVKSVTSADGSVVIDESAVNEPDLSVTNYVATQLGGYLPLSGGTISNSILFDNGGPNAHTVFIGATNSTGISDTTSLFLSGGSRLSAEVPSIMMGGPMYFPAPGYMTFNVPLDGPAADGEYQFNFDGNMRGRWVDDNLSIYNKITIWGGSIDGGTAWATISAAEGLKLGEESFYIYPSGDIEQSPTNLATLGILTAQTVSASAFYGDGSQLTGVEGVDTNESYTFATNTTQTFDLVKLGGTNDILLGTYSNTQYGYHWTDQAGYDDTTVVIGDVDAPSDVAPNGVVIGRAASYSGVGKGIAIGFDANAGGDRSIAIGPEASANGSYSTVIGYSSDAPSTFGTVVGYNSYAGGTKSVAIGGATSRGEDTIVGYGAFSFSGSRSTAVGGNSAINGSYASAFGYESDANDYGVALGAFADVGAIDKGIAIGYNADAAGNRAITVGAEAEADSAYSVAIGYNADCSGGDGFSTAIGSGAICDDHYATAIGNNSKASAANTLAAGRLSEALERHSVAVGGNATASNVQSIALGMASSAEADGAITLGAYTTNRTENSLLVGRSNLVFMTAGHDGTSGYVETDKIRFSDATEMTTAPVGVDVNASYTFAAGTTQVFDRVEIKDRLTITNEPPRMSIIDGGSYAGIRINGATKFEGVSLGLKNIGTYGNQSIHIGGNSYVGGDYSVGIGSGHYAPGDYSVVIGRNAYCGTDGYNTFLGANSGNNYADGTVQNQSLGYSANVGRSDKQCNVIGANVDLRGITTTTGKNDSLTVIGDNYTDTEYRTNEVLFVPGGQLVGRFYFDEDTNSVLEVDTIAFGDATTLSAAPTGVDTNESYTFATNTTQTFDLVKLGGTNDVVLGQYYADEQYGYRWAPDGLAYSKDSILIGKVDDSVGSRYTDSSIVIGNSAQCGDASLGPHNFVVIGHNAYADGYASTAIGSQSTVGYYNSVGVGYNADADGYSSVAVGANAHADNSRAVSVGADSGAGDYAVAVGYNTTASSSSIAIGDTAGTAGANYAVQIGWTAYGADNSVSIGAQAGGYVGTDSVCIGHQSQQPYVFPKPNEMVALGSKTIAKSNNCNVIGYSMNTGDFPESNHEHRTLIGSDDRAHLIAGSDSQTNSFAVIDMLHLTPMPDATTTNTGTIYYDSDDNKVKVWTGATWENLN
jgi:hypothetical protein